MISITMESYQMCYAALGALFALTAIFALLGWRNSIYQGERANEIGQMLMEVNCQLEGDDEAHARILKMTVDEYKTERAKGRVLFRAGQEVCGIAEGLKSPFRFWR